LSVPIGLCFEQYAFLWMCMSVELLHPLGIRSQHLLGGTVGAVVGDRVGDRVGDVGDEVGARVGGAAKKFVGAEVGDGTAVGLAVGATPDVTFVYNVWFRSESIRCCTLASSRAASVENSVWFALVAFNVELPSLFSSSAATCDSCELSSTSSRICTTALVCAACRRRPVGGRLIPCTDTTLIRWRGICSNIAIFSTTLGPSNFTTSIENVMVNCTTIDA